MGSMKMLTVSGSGREDSTNSKVLHRLKFLSNTMDFRHTNLPFRLPLFNANLDQNPLPELVLEWRRELVECDGLIICTPEYIHNLPAALKNALEWVTSSGELKGKKVLAMTFTPYAPRGSKAMQSLLWSLNALEANVTCSLSLYYKDIHFSDKEKLKGEGVDLLKEALNLF